MFFVRPEPLTSPPTRRPTLKEAMGLVPPPLIPVREPKPMTITQLDEWFDRIIAGNLCRKCDSDFVDEKGFCPKCNELPKPIRWEPMRK